MKKTGIATVALLLAGTFTFAQDIITALHVEYTVTGPEYGTSFTYESKGQWGFGIFYQGQVNPSDDTFVKDQFYGANIQVPFVKSDRISFYAALRGGFVNDKFVIVVPGLETRINLGKRVAMAFGMSLRKNYPSVSSKLGFKLF